MKSIVIQPSSLKGSVMVSAEDESARVAVCCAALSHGMSYLSHMPQTYDFQLFIDAVSQMGMKVMKKREVGDQVDYLIKGTTRLQGATIQNAGSERNLRWLIPLAGRCEEPVRLSTKSQISHDFLVPYLAVLNEKRVIYHSERGHFPLVVDGTLPGGEYRISESFPSLALAGLLLALPAGERDSWIEFPPDYKRHACLDLVIDLMARFEMEVIEEQNRLRVPGRQSFQPADFTIDANMQTGMVWLLADAIGGEVAIEGIKRASLQQERTWKSLFQKIGLEIQKGESKYWLDGRQYTELNLTCEEEDFAIFATAGLLFAEGESRIEMDNISKKTLNRLSGLQSLGAEIEIQDGFWQITGRDELLGGEVNVSGDPLFGMLVAILSTRSRKPIIVHGFEWIHHQEPKFWKQFSQLGGKVSEEEMV